MRKTAVRTLLLLTLFAGALALAQTSADHRLDRRRPPTGGYELPQPDPSLGTAYAFPFEAFVQSDLYKPRDIYVLGYVAPYNVLAYWADQRFRNGHFVWRIHLLLPRDFPGAEHLARRPNVELLLVPPEYLDPRFSYAVIPTNHVLTRSGSRYRYQNNRALAGALLANWYGYREGIPKLNRIYQDRAP